MTEFISDEDIQKAVDYLRDSATEAAEARANKMYLEAYRKSMKGLIMNQHANLPLAAQERNAYSSPDYIAHLRALKEAVFLDAKHTFLRGAAEAKIQAWQTMSANNRGTRI